MQQNSYYPVRGAGRGWRAIRYAYETVSDCVICEDEYPESNMTKFPCGHHHCSHCVSHQARTALSNPSSAPPLRCCGKIPLSLAQTRKSLTSSLFRRYYLQRVEGNIKDKTYCTGPSCSAFIKPHSIHNGEAICQKCFKRTCAKCKLPWHWGACSSDAKDDFFKGLAEEEGWKQCPGCSAMIEWEGGCYLIDCDCGTQFCFYCAHEMCVCSDPSATGEDEETRADDMALKEINEW